ncbi:bifunctional glutamate N-acetyltransferase/amino-acid acetyltransferase ArgJ [soil metagenome]
MNPEETALEIPSGFRAAGVRAGIKPSGLPDLAVLVADKTCSAAGTFTTNRVAAAPVLWDRAIVPSESVRAIVINAGNANAATGALGFENTRRTAELAAQRLACQPEQILIASTGVIGHQLPMDKLEAGLDAAWNQVTEEASGFHDASEAILTTDTRPKILSKSLKLADGRRLRMLGLAKGAAMIGPRMATMLGFLLTDARVLPGALQGILSDAVDSSFNCISVEGHTSTNDSVLLLASGRDVPPLAGDDLKAFAGLVRETCRDLARMIPDDGEGATHLITIDVEGCADTEQARAIARAVADSPLVKTAIHGADPNWGRIVSAAGYAGVPFEESELSLSLNKTLIYREGAPIDFDAATLSSQMRQHREVDIRLSIKQGDTSIRFWTCDLTAEYIRLNADYTT